MRIFRRYQAKHRDTAAKRVVRATRAQELRRAELIESGVRSDWKLTA
jgi:hypothetical protein